ADGGIEMPPALPGIVAISQERKRSLFESVFDDLDDLGVVLLLAQEAMGAGSSDYLIDHAKQRFGDASVVHIVSSICSDDEIEEYFSDIGRQLGLHEKTPSAAMLERKLPEVLSSRNKVVLVFSHFENGTVKAVHALASALRGFLERDRSRVRLLFRGGEKLA